MDDIKRYRERAIKLVEGWAGANTFDRPTEVEAHISAENLMSNGQWIAYLVIEPDDQMLYQVHLNLKTDKMICEVFGTTRPFNDLIEEER